MPALSITQPETSPGAAVAAASDGQLEGFFENLDEEVRSDLFEKPHLVSMLREIANVVPDYFGSEVGLSLQVVRDPEDGEDGELFVLVETSLPPDEALAKLRAFDEEWWFDRLRSVGGQITVTLEYA